MHRDRSRGTVECHLKATRPAATRAWKPRPGLQLRLHCQVAPLLHKRGLQRRHQTSARSLSSFEADLRLCLKEAFASTQGPVAMHRDRSRSTMKSHLKATRPAATMAGKPRPALQLRLHCQVPLLLPKRALQRRHQTSARSLSSFEADLRLCLKEAFAST